MGRIGRITTNLLSTLATEIDLIEPIAKFTASLHGKDGVRTIYNCGLEAWRPEEDTKYDLVWTQWCVGHLTDRQLVEYLERCRDALAEDGVVVIKENLSTSGRDAFDEEDSSVTRYVFPRLISCVVIVLIGRTGRIPSSRACLRRRDCRL
jgi:protein N-terminal methyltransferase